MWESCPLSKHQWAIKTFQWFIIPATCIDLHTKTNQICHYHWPWPTSLSKNSLFQLYWRINSLLSVVGILIISHYRNPYYYYYHHQCITFTIYIVSYIYCNHYSTINDHRPITIMAWSRSLRHLLRLLLAHYTWRCNLLCHPRCVFWWWKIEGSYLGYYSGLNRMKLIWTVWAFTLHMKRIIIGLMNGVLWFLSELLWWMK